MFNVRFWYEKLVIPSGVREHQAAVIKCQIFPMRPVENLTQLVSEINNFLSSNSCDGGFYRQVQSVHK